MHWKQWCFVVISVLLPLACNEPAAPTTVNESDQVSSIADCLLDGHDCEARASYQVVEDHRFLNEPGPHTRLLTVRAKKGDALPGEYLEFALSGPVTSGEYHVELNDPFNGDRTIPPSLKIILPEEHPESVEEAIDWYSGGGVRLTLDFVEGEFELSFNAVKFRNIVRQDRLISFDQQSTIRGPLTAECHKGNWFSGESDTPFCEEELAKLRK